MGKRLDILLSSFLLLIVFLYFLISNFLLNFVLYVLMFYFFYKLKYEKRSFKRNIPDMLMFYTEFVVGIIVIGLLINMSTSFFIDYIKYMTYNFYKLPIPQKTPIDTLKDNLNINLGLFFLLLAVDIGLWIFLKLTEKKKKR